MKLARKLVFLHVMQETNVEVKESKLVGLAPKYENGLWITRGRLDKGIFKVLGVTELPILVLESRLAQLLMAEAHEDDH